MKSKPSKTSKVAAPKAPAFFTARYKKLSSNHAKLVKQRNPIDAEWDNGVYERFVNPIVTYRHIPLDWRFDLNPKTNPLLIERLAINATLNPGAFFWKGKIHLVVRIEGTDRKSFFAIAESANGVDNWKFWDEPIDLPEIKPETNVYDMRVVFHEDGWIYGLFCSESKDPNAKPGDNSSAVAAAAIARTKDFIKWERLPNLKIGTAQQRNVVLHPEFVGGKYALYTRPSDGFMDVGSAGGIGWALADNLTGGKISAERIIEGRAYHTIKEYKNGQGPAPIKTDKGWLHLAHGVRGCAAGLRYVLYMFMTSLEDPTKVIARPGGHFIAPHKGERVGDVSNVTFANGWVKLNDKKQTVMIYYAGSDTRIYAARSSVAQLVDWCLNTPEDGLTTRACADQRRALIRANRALLA